MTQDEFKAQMKAEIEKSELELKAKKILMKQLSKAPSKPFIETKFARGLNHFLAFISTPCAVTNRNARMKLDHPRAYRAEMVIEKAEKLVEKLDKETREVGAETNKLAAIAALHETMLSEFQDMDDYGERIAHLRTQLVRHAQRLRKTGNGPQADVASSLEELMERLKKGVGKEGPEPQGI